MRTALGMPSIFLKNHGTHIAAQRELKCKTADDDDDDGEYDDDKGDGGDGLDDGDLCLGYLLPTFYRNRSSMTTAKNKLAKA